MQPVAFVKNFRSFVVGTLFLAISQVGISGAMAQTPPTHEVTGGTNSKLTLIGGNVDIGLNAGYFNYVFPDANVQLGYLAQFTYFNVGNVITWYNTFLARYNLGRTQNFLKQPFIEGGLGLLLSDHEGISLSSSLLWQIGAGKRYQLADNIAWVPAVSLRKVDGESLSFVVTPIALSVVF